MARRSLAGAAGGARRHRGDAVVLRLLGISAGIDPVRDLDRAGDGLARTHRPRSRARWSAGHLVSALVGLLVLQVTGPEPWAAAFAVGLAIVAMHVTRHISSAGRDQSAADRGQRHAVELPRRAGRRRRGAARGLRMALAQLGAGKNWPSAGGEALRGRSHGALLPLLRGPIEIKSEARAGFRSESDETWLFDNLIGR